jgi:hypothetical protein
MTSEDLGILFIRAASLIFGAAIALLPILLYGKVVVYCLVLAAPFFLAALAPLTIGPYVGKGATFLATLVTFYDPPSFRGSDVPRSKNAGRSACSPPPLRECLPHKTPAPCGAWL